MTATLSITQPGKYNVEVSACAGTWVSSTAVQVDFIQLPVPVISADKPVYCVGDNATLSIAITPNAAYTINWYLNNALLTANTNLSSITTNTAGNYTVSLVSNTVNTDGTTCSQTSAVQPLFFNPRPTVSIEKIVKTTICDGQTIDLLAHYNGGTVKWSTGETSDQIGVTTPGNYTATVTSPTGCQVNSVIAVTFLPNPIFNIKDTSICTYKHENITLTAPPGFSNYSWNGAPGSQTYQVSFPQTVNLVITDAKRLPGKPTNKNCRPVPGYSYPQRFYPQWRPG